MSICYNVDMQKSTNGLHRDKLLVISLSCGIRCSKPMTTLTEPGPKQRIESIDILRGLIMLIMAIDHTRDYFHKGGIDPTNLAVTTPFLFFTRWITHFCAPLFVFLSGISANLAGTRRTRPQFSAFLIKRGLWLVLIELVVITFALTADPGYHFIVLQVIWAIGFSMILLGLLIWLPIEVIAVLGVVIFFGHDLLDNRNLPNTGAGAFLLKMFMTARGFISPINQTHFLGDFYAVIPWTGVMMLGYVFGNIYRSSFDAARRKKILLLAGGSLIALFIILRTFNIYGDPIPWEHQKTMALTVIAYFDVSKYPPSLIYLCMTIGPGLLLLVLFERVKNGLTNIFVIYGSVPFFYYVCHFYLIRLINVIVFYADGYTNKDIVNKSGGFNFVPKGFGFELPGVYLVWFIVIVLLYLPCRWYFNYKRTHRQWWLSYL